DAFEVNGPHHVPIGRLHRLNRDPHRPPPSFPGSAWERPVFEAPPRSLKRPRGRASHALRSQAEPANEVYGSLSARRYFITYLPNRSVSTLTASPTCLKPSVVIVRVCGIRATLNRSASTSTSVRLTPSTATEPLVTIWPASSGGTANQIVSHSPCCSRAATR